MKHLPIMSANFKMRQILVDGFYEEEPKNDPLSPLLLYDCFARIFNIC